MVCPLLWNNNDSFSACTGQFNSGQRGAFSDAVADQAAPALPDIQLIEKSTQQGLLIRWAPTNPVTWQMGMRYGYRLERQVLKQGYLPGKPFCSGNRVAHQAMAAG
ncbi:MAG: hypothetical protein H6561_19315 [Lewinellaceae bacterium]|nr:hypothetical protein [Lewinellaceae bacterium]